MPWSVLVTESERCPGRACGAAGRSDSGMSMAVERIDPLNDPRWAAFLERHSEATVFHTPPWLNALARTYGYKPVVYGHTREDEVTSGIVFCRVNSWLTGSRLVSLPFSDHCQPLVSRFGDLGEMLSAVQAARQAEEWKYIELRPMASNPFATEQTGFRKRIRVRSQA